MKSKPSPHTATGLCTHHGASATVNRAAFAMGWVDWDGIKTGIASVAARFERYASHLSVRVRPYSPDSGESTTTTLPLLGGCPGFRVEVIVNPNQQIHFCLVRRAAIHPAVRKYSLSLALPVPRCCISTVATHRWVGCFDGHSRAGRSSPSL